MTKKLYIGGLPWELDRIGVLNYVKAILECNDIQASFELPFITAPLVNPNAAVRISDVFVAMDRNTGKSRGFGFVTMEFLNGENADTLFAKVLELLNKRIVIGIRGPRELIVNEAEEEKPDFGGRRDGAPMFDEAAAAPVDAQPAADAPAPVAEAEADDSADEADNQGSAESLF